MLTKKKKKISSFHVPQIARPETMFIVRITLFSVPIPALLWFRYSKYRRLIGAELLLC
jgi:hypothetical protein